MIANYHTHTFRCYHAMGKERYYIQTAIKAGLKTLGFADHAPMPFPGRYESTYRMPISLFSNYMETLSALREEYRDKIDIKIGLEAEYYPAIFEDFLDLIRPFGIDYLILGQHFIGNEYDRGSVYMGTPYVKEKELTAYIDQVVAAIKTGVFTYIAHPDLPGVVGDDAFYTAESRRLCRAAREHDLPLEYNLLGMATGRLYPARRFFEIAAEEGNAVILGADAHSPDRVAKPEEIQTAKENLAALGIEPIKTLPLFRPIR